MVHSYHRLYYHRQNSKMPAGQVRLGAVGCGIKGSPEQENILAFILPLQLLSAHVCGTYRFKISLDSQLLETRLFAAFIIPPYGKPFRSRIPSLGIDSWDLVMATIVFFIRFRLLQECPVPDCAAEMQSICMRDKQSNIWRTQRF